MGDMKKILATHLKIKMSTKLLPRSTLEETIIPKKIIATRSKYRREKTHYCGGCGHEHLHNIIANVCEELKIGNKVIFVATIGCSVYAYKYFNFDSIQVPHGRGPAVATGIKGANKDLITVLQQGDGDLAAIGWNETWHAANRGENITILFINNGIYAMTGGQQAPTTLLGSKTTTTPSGKKIDTGYPIHVCEALNVLQAPCFLTRTALYNLQRIKETHLAVKKAIINQIEGKGFSLVEILSQCPTQWHMTAQEALDYVKNVMEKEFPLGVIRDL